MLNLFQYLPVGEVTNLTELDASALLVGELVSRTRLCRTKRLSIVLREGVPFRVGECIFLISYYRLLTVEKILKQVQSDVLGLILSTIAFICSFSSIGRSHLRYFSKYSTASTYSFLAIKTTPSFL
jgi:hypothetical protein